MSDSHKSTSYKGPLSGLNVIDFGHYFAGPMAAMLLADQGANVIHIDKPGASELPVQQRRLLNRNKKSLSLDLKTEEGKQQALELVKQADVLIENFRPGVMQRLGLDYARVKKINSALVYLSIPGFSATDKKRAHLQAWEGVMAAAAGLQMDISYVRKYLKFPPLYSSVPVNSMYGGVHGAIAVMSALLARDENGGHGNYIEVSQADAGMNAFGFRFLGLVRIKEDGSPFRTGDRQDTDDPWQAQKANWYSPGDSEKVLEEKLYAGMQAFWGQAFARNYRCADGRWICLFFPDFPDKVETFYKVIGIYEKLLQEGFVLVGRPWEAKLDNDLSSYSALADARKQHVDQLVTETLLTKTAGEWEALLGQLVPIAVIRTREEYMNLPPILESGVLTKMEKAGEPTLTVPSRFVDISGPGNQLIEGYAEEQAIDFADASQVFAQGAGKPPLNESAAPQVKGELLQGLKVLDISNGIAGPMSGYVMAQYGAEVIKVDAYSRTPPGLHYVMMEVGQGKQSTLVDFKTVPGQDILRRMVNWADVVVHNNLDNVNQRLGLTHEDFKKIKPSIVSCQVSCAGGAHRGGWELRLGFDPIAQAITGLMSHYGSATHPQWHEGTMIADSMGGYALAFSALLGVWQQRKTGYGGEGRTSLARASNFIQLPTLIAENNKLCMNDPSGQFALGENAWQRLYECSDGWIFVGASENRAEMLAETVTEKTEIDERALAAAFIQQSCQYWLDKLAAVNIAAHRVLSVTDICNEQLLEVGNEQVDTSAEGCGKILCYKNHPSGMPVLVQSPDWVKVGDNYSYRRCSLTSPIGFDTREVLAALDYSSQDIDQLIRLRVVHESLSGLQKGQFFPE